MHHFLLLSEFCNDLPLCSQNHQPQSGIGKMRVDVLPNLTKKCICPIWKPKSSAVKGG